MSIFNITLRSTPSLQTSLFPLRSPHQNSACTSSVSHTCQYSWYDNPKNVEWKVQTMKLFVPRPKHREIFRNIVNFYGEEMLAPTNSKARRLPLVGCPRLLIQYISRYPLYPEAVSNPQAEDAPSCDDGGPRYPSTKPKLYSEIYVISTDQ